MEVEILPAKRGPVSRFDTSFCDKIIQIAAQGGHIPAMMQAIDISSKATWYKWQKDYPEFKEAVEAAELTSQAFYEQIGLKGILGEISNFNATTYALIMNNKFSSEYKRNASSSEINITNNTVNLTREELKLKLIQKSEKLKLMNISEFEEFDPIIHE